MSPQSRKTGFSHCGPYILALSSGKKLSYISLIAGIFSVAPAASMYRPNCSAKYVGFGRPSGNAAVCSMTAPIYSVHRRRRKSGSASITSADHRPGPKEASVWRWIRTAASSAPAGRECGRHRRQDARECRLQTTRCRRSRCGCAGGTTRAPRARRLCCGRAGSGHCTMLVFRNKSSSWGIESTCNLPKAALPYSPPGGVLGTSCDTRRHSIAERLPRPLWSLL